MPQRGNTNIMNMSWIPMRCCRSTCTEMLNWDLRGIAFQRSPHWLSAKGRLQILHHLVPYLHLLLIECKQGLHLQMYTQWGTQFFWVDYCGIWGLWDGNKPNSAWMQPCFIFYTNTVNVKCQSNLKFCFERGLVVDGMPFITTRSKV